MFDPLFLLNENNYVKVSMKQHTVKFCLPDLNQMFNNKVLGVTFRTTKEKPFVIDYGEGDYRSIASEALCRNYCLTTGTPLTQVTLNKLKREDGYIIDWTLVKTTDIGVKRSVLACRVTDGVTFPYQIGDTLFYVNDKSVEHDKGDILIGVKQGNAIAVVDIVNGETFKRLFDNRIVVPCLGAKEQATKPVSLAKPVSNISNRVNKPQVQEQKHFELNDISRIQLQAEKAAFSLDKADCLKGTVSIPTVEVLQCYPQYKEKILSLWLYVTKFITLINRAYVGFCTNSGIQREAYDLYPAEVTCKEVKLHDTEYGIEFRIISPLNLNKLKLSSPADLTREKTGFIWKFLFTVSAGGKLSADVDEYVLHFSIEDKIVKTACTFKSEFLIDGVRQSTERSLLKDVFLYLPWNNLFNPLLDDAYHTPAEQIHEAIRLMTVNLIKKRTEYDRIQKKRLQDEAKEQLHQDWEERKNKVKSLFRGNKKQKHSLPTAEVQETLHDITDLARELEQIIDRSKHLGGEVQFCNVKALLSVQKDLPAIKSLWKYLLVFVQFLDNSFDVPVTLDTTGELAKEKELLDTVIASISGSEYMVNNQYNVMIKLFCNLSDVGNQNTGFRMEFNFSVEKGMQGVSQLPYYRIRNTVPPVFMTVKVAPIVNGKAMDVLHYRLGSEMYSPYGELSNIPWDDLAMDMSGTSMPAATAIMHNVLVSMLKQIRGVHIQFSLGW